MFNQDIMKNCIIYISSQLGKRGIVLNETKLYKILWFANLHYADNNGDLLFSDLFIKKDYGPVPELSYDYIDNVKSKWNEWDEFLQISTSFFQGFSSYKENKISHKKEVDEDFLTDYMKDSLNFAIENYWNKSAWELSSITHQKWSAWDVTSQWAVIDITIDMKNFEMKDLVKERIDELKVLLRTLKYA